MYFPILHYIIYDFQFTPKIQDIFLAKNITFLKQTPKMQAFSPGCQRSPSNLPQSVWGGW